jgi:hypothetical protein
MAICQAWPAAMAALGMTAAATCLVLRKRDWTTIALVILLFGTVHGLGFAEVLRALGPGAVRPAPVFLFNLGVELGQLLAVLAAWPILKLAQRRRYTREHLRPALVGTVAALAVFWTVTRSAAWVTG